jgi:thiol-disulfide isomerase/thioredoxin
VGSPLPAYNVTTLEDSTTTELPALTEDKFLVIDFWTSKCVKCPSALDKLNEEAITYSENAKFVSVALSQGIGNIDIVRDLVE